MRQRVQQRGWPGELQEVVLALLLVPDLERQRARVPVVLALDGPTGVGDLSLDVGQDLGSAVVLGRGGEDERQVIEARVAGHREFDRRDRESAAADYSG